MSSSTIQGWRGGVLAVLAAVTLAAPGWAANERLRIAVGQGEVVASSDEVRTVAVAEPKIADAAVGSARTVVVNGKTPGLTTLVVYTEGGRYKVYDVEVYQPHGDEQVKLHVTVAEVTDNAKRELGFDLLGQAINNVPWLDGLIQGGFYTTKVESPTIPLSVGPSTDGFVHYERNDGRIVLQSTWRALEEKGDIRVLANPTLVAKSGEKASFLAGGEFPIPVASGGGTGLIAVTILWREFGVKLEFTPTVEDRGNISLKVAPEVSQIDFSNPLTLQGFRIPVLISRKANTTVRMQSGEFLIIGGLKQKDTVRVNKRVPILGSIPILGFFFSTSRKESTERELMVMVTPEMATPTARAPGLPTDRPERK